MKEIPIEDVPVAVVVPRFRLPPFAPTTEGFPEGLRVQMRALPVGAPLTTQTLDALQHKYRRHAIRTIVATGAIRPFTFGRLLYKISIGLLAIERPEALSCSPLRDKLPDAARFVMDDIYSAPARKLSNGFFGARLFTAEYNDREALFSGIQLFGSFDDTEYFCRLLDDTPSFVAVHFDQTGRLPIGP